MKFDSLFKSLNPSRIRLREINGQFAATIPENAYVLDAGAGKAPYQDLFRHPRYETADFEQVDKEYAPSTYVCDLSAIPVESDATGIVKAHSVNQDHTNHVCLRLRSAR